MLKPHDNPQICLHCLPRPSEFSHIVSCFIPSTQRFPLFVSTALCCCPSSWGRLAPLAMARSHLLQLQSQQAPKCPLRQQSHPQSIHPTTQQSVHGLNSHLMLDRLLPGQQLHIVVPSSARSMAFHVHKAGALQPPEATMER